MCPASSTYVDKIVQLFEKEGGTVYYVELEADLDTRLERNTTPFRLSKKASKLNTEKSREGLLELEKKHRMNSAPGEFKRAPYIRINNTTLSATETAEKIKTSFGL